MVALLFLLGSGGDVDLDRAIRETGAVESYNFRRATNNAVVEGTYKKGAPVHLKADRIEFFRQADKLVYKQKDTWLKTRTGTLSDPLPILGASAKVRATRLPHEELASLGKALINAIKTEDAGRALYTAEFPEATARELAAIEDRDLARGGTARLWLNKGRFVKYQVTIQLRGRRGNAEVDGVVTTDVSLSAIGTAKLNVPPQALKALE